MAKSNNRVNSPTFRQAIQQRGGGVPLMDSRPHTVIQQKANHMGLPDQLKANLEKLSGYSMEDVRVHYNSPKPAQLHAQAYAQGTDIHLGPGQSQHLPHEAWHIVQQKQGRVRPTLQMNGAAINDNRELEREADVMGAKATQMKASGVYTEGKIPMHIQTTLFSGAKIIQRMVAGGLQAGTIVKIISSGEVCTIYKEQADRSTGGYLLNTNDGYEFHHYSELDLIQPTGAGAGAGVSAVHQLPQRGASRGIALTPTRRSPLRRGLSSTRHSRATAAAESSLGWFGRGPEGSVPIPTRTLRGVAPARRRAPSSARHIRATAAEESVVDPSERAAKAFLTHHGYDLDGADGDVEIHNPTLTPQTCHSYVFGHHEDHLDIVDVPQVLDTWKRAGHPHILVCMGSGMTVAHTARKLGNGRYLQTLERGPVFSTSRDTLTRKYGDTFALPEQEEELNRADTEYQEKKAAIEEAQRRYDGVYDEILRTYRNNRGDLSEAGQEEATRIFIQAEDHYIAADTQGHRLPNDLERLRGIIPS